MPTNTKLTRNKHLSVKEKNNVLAVRRLLKGAVKNNTSVVAFAWAVDPKSITTWEKKVEQNRKVRRDKGTIKIILKKYQ